MRAAAVTAVSLLIIWTVLLGHWTLKHVQNVRQFKELETQCFISPKPQPPSLSSSVLLVGR